jgi:hypothetical protein
LNRFQLFVFSSMDPQTTSEVKTTLMALIVVMAGDTSGC